MTWGSVHGPACDDDLIASLQAGVEPASEEQDAQIIQ